MKILAIIAIITIIPIFSGCGTLTVDATWKYPAVEALEHRLQAEAVQ